MDDLAALRLQVEWGADEALLEAPQNRFAAPPLAATAPSPSPSPSPAPSPRVAAGPVASRPAGPFASRPAGVAEAENIAAACATLSELQAALQTFTGCGLRDTATQLVFADGAETTKLMLIGEAPGAEEDRAGRPFIGPAGQLLDKMLASVSLDRTKLRIVNVVPWRPPGNRTPSEFEIAVCLPFLRRHIALIQPGCVVLLGAVAAKAMLPGAVNAGIRRLRGQWRTLDVPGLGHEIACLPTYHPAYLLRTASAKRESWHDFIAVRQWMDEQDNRL